MPLIITEDETYKAALTFYPQLSLLKKELHELSSDFLAENFDAIFKSGKFWAAELDPVFKVLYNKTMRFVFCPHGNSDKGYSGKNHINQDISLVYGQHMIDLLTSTGAIKKIATFLKTSNYRLPFYLKYKSFYDSLAENLVLNKIDKTKKTILYAPTWQDGENPSSFFFGTEKLINQLGDHFNIIIKMHPFLEKFHPARTYSITGLHENRPGIVFLNAFPAIYPLLNASDIYIGDYSSIGYDFLAFDKPLYFLTEKKQEEGPIHKCGLRIPSLEGILDFIQTTLKQNQTEKSKARKETYSYAFGEEKSFSNIKQDILQALI